MGNQDYRARRFRDDLTRLGESLYIDTCDIEVGETSPELNVVRNEVCKGFYENLPQNRYFRIEGGDIFYTPEKDWSVFIKFLGRGNKSKGMVVQKDLFSYTFCAPVARYALGFVDSGGNYEFFCCVFSNIGKRKNKMNIPILLLPRKGNRMIRVGRFVRRSMDSLQRNFGRYPMDFVFREGVEYAARLFSSKRGESA